MSHTAETCLVETHDHWDPEAGEPTELICADCGRRSFYDRVIDDYRHSDPAAPGCFLIPREGAS